MGHGEAFGGNAFIAVEQDVQIQRAWRVAVGSFATRFGFYGLQCGEQIVGKQRGADFKHRVDVIRPAGIDGRGAVAGGFVGDARACQLRNFLHRIVQRSMGIAQIGT